MISKLVVQTPKKSRIVLQNNPDWTRLLTDRIVEPQRTTHMPEKDETEGKYMHVTFQVLID